MAATGSHSLTLHDALPISLAAEAREVRDVDWVGDQEKIETFRRSGLPDTIAAHCEDGHAEFLGRVWQSATDRKSTRLNSSHVRISYAVFCLKKKNRSSKLQ